MTEYFEKDSKVEAFQINYSFEMNTITYKSGDWVVIKDGKGSVITNSEFQQKYIKKTETISLNHYFPTKEYVPVPYPVPSIQPVSPFRQTYWGSQPFTGINTIGSLGNVLGTISNINND